MSDSDERVSIAVLSELDGAATKSITDILNENNEKLGFVWKQEPLVLIARDESGEVIGGLSGSTNWGWLHVRLLAVNIKVRGTGLGRKLLAQAEKVALERGCEHAYLDTFSFQARGFYEKQGYSVWGELEDFPAGESRFFMRKEIQ